MLEKLSFWKDDLFDFVSEQRRLLGVVALAGLLIMGLLALGGWILLHQYNTAILLQPTHGLSFATVTPTADSSLPELGAEHLQIEAVPPTPTQAEATPRPYFADANEMGQVLLLMYHRITYPEMRYQRTPANFKADLERLHRNGYYPVNFSHLLAGLSNVPPGKKPILITFDDSDISQFRVLSDRTIDANSALGIMLNFHKQHPEEWPMHATFFILADDRNDNQRIFGQSEFAAAKLKLLLQLGMEVSSHTVTHADLSVATSERIQWELAVSKHVLEKLVPDYTVQTLAVPFGGFPYTTDFLRAGQWQHLSYTYSGNAAAWGGPSVSPFSSGFQRYKVPRMEVTADSIDHWLDYFEAHPDEYFVADGDPDRVTYPQTEPELTEAR